MRRRALTDAEVREIQALFKKGTASSAIARRYGISKTLSYEIKNGIRIPYDPKLRKLRTPNPPAKNPGSFGKKLTEQQVREIRKRLAAKATLKVIGKEFGVSPPTIAAIRDGITFKQVK